MQYKTAAYTAINPLQRVPVLMVDELWISNIARRVERYGT
jgi:glutathione S-transferase